MERNTWKGKCEAIEHKWFSLQEEFAALYEKFKHANSFQKEAKTHDSPSTLATHVTDSENSLKEVENRY